MFTWVQIQEQILEVSRSGLIHLLIGLIVLDILTGTIKSFKEKNTSSTVSLFGVIKHLLVVMLVFLIAVYFPLFNFGWLSQTFIIYMLISYGISLTENWTLLGLPMPNIVKERLVKLRDEIDRGEIEQLYKETIDPDFTGRD